MTVAELMAELKAMPPDVEVWWQNTDGAGWGSVSSCGLDGNRATVYFSEYELTYVRDDE